MKVVIQNNSRVWGGNEKWLATLAAGLLARGHRVVVSCRRDGAVRPELERRGIPTAAVRPGVGADVVRGVRFARWLRRERPDALLLTSWKTTAWGAWAARRAGVPRVVVRLGIVRGLRRRRHARAFRRAVHALIVNSAEIRDEWLRSAPWFPAGAVHVVLNGIVVPPPLPPEERAAVRRELGASPDACLVAGAGHVHRRKGFDLLLEAFARAAVPDAEAAILGTGPEEVRLRAWAESLGIAERVRWPGHRGDVVRVLAACDLFVLSSRNEGMANVMLEAMAAGTPVVATDVSGVRAALGEQGGRPPAGWIVPPDDPAAMAEAMRAVLQGDLGEVRRRVEEASWRVARWFGVERMVDEAEAVLRGDASARG
ncbi:MAG TPA: glycosyltransferase [Longimicrobium sp.]|jgi:glycosyltransferase involved in cell wall biosynthesis